MFGSIVHSMVFGSQTKPHLVQVAGHKSVGHAQQVRDRSARIAVELEVAVAVLVEEEDAGVVHHRRERVEAAVEHVVRGAAIEYGKTTH